MSGRVRGLPCPCLEVDSVQQLMAKMAQDVASVAGKDRLAVHQVAWKAPRQPTLQDEMYSGTLYI